MMWTLLSWAAAAELLDQTWLAVHDTVMGGVSSGDVQRDARSLRFTGTLSLDQGGGFVSARTADAPLGLDGAVALRLHVRGDGRSWDLTLRRDDVPLRGGSYRAGFIAPPEGAIVEIPLADFRPRSFGRPVAGLPALDRALDRVVSVGFLLADGRPGAFELEVTAVEVLRGPAAPTGPRGEVRQAIERALADGVPRFNQGDHAGCAARYRQALGELRDHPSLSAGERSLVGEALTSAQAQQPTAAAWTLRGALDSLARG